MSKKKTNPITNTCLADALLESYINNYLEVVRERAKYYRILTMASVVGEPCLFNAWQYMRMSEQILREQTPPLFYHEPWYAKWRYRHMAFVDTNFPDMISFYSSSYNGERGNVTRMKVGRYLKKFVPTLASTELIRETDKHKAEFVKTIKFAYSEEDILDVYLNGPESCMSHEPEWYLSEIHPVRLYGRCPDIAVAYIYKDSYCGEVSARAVCNMARKEYTCVYGDSTLSLLLDEAGFTEGGIEGAVLPLIWHKEDESIIMPYVDGTCTNFDIVYDTCVFDGDGQYSAAERNGYEESGGVLALPIICGNCGVATHEAQEDINGIEICPSCTSNYYVSAKDEYGAYQLVHIESDYCVAEDSTWFVDSDAAEANGYVYVTTENDGGYVHEENVVYLEDDTPVLKRTAVAIYDVNDEHVYIREQDFKLHDTRYDTTNNRLYCMDATQYMLSSVFVASLVISHCTEIFSVRSTGEAIGDAVLGRAYAVFGSPMFSTSIGGVLKSATIDLMKDCLDKYPDETDPAVLMVNTIDTCLDIIKEVYTEQQEQPAVETA